MQREDKRVSLTVNLTFELMVPEHEVEDFLLDDDDEAKETAIWNMIGAWHDPKSPRDIEDRKYVEYQCSVVERSDDD